MIIASSDPQESPPPVSRRRTDRRLVPVLRGLLDFLAILLAFWTSFLIRAWLGSAQWMDPIDLDPSWYRDLAILFGVVTVAVFWKLGLYRDRASILNLHELEQAWKGILLAAALYLAVIFLLAIPHFSRLVTFGAFAFAMMYVALERRLFSTFARGMGLSGRIGRRKVLIYGCGETGRLLMKKLVQAPHKACTVVGFLDDFAPKNAPVECRIDQKTMEVYEARVLGRLQDLGQIAHEKGVDELLVTVSLTNAERHHELTRLAREAGVHVGVVPRFGEIRADQLEVEDISAITLLRPRAVRSRPFYAAAKRLCDVAIALVLMLLMLPIWILAAVGIRLESGPPILFRQARVGKDGRPFVMFKFRTMRQDTNPYESSPIGDSGDPRITRVGRFLRMGGLDELPQLINVLKGEMSIVGPRPEMPFIVERYTALERQRLQAKPGITGIWQLSSDRHAEIHENLEYDLYYIQHRSLLLDFLIMLETLFFTVGLVTRVRRRETMLEDEPGVVIRPWRPAQETKREAGYVLIALDQRWTGIPPESWVACTSIVDILLEHCHVKFLVATDNVTAFDSLLESSPIAKSNGHLAEYVPYTGRSELRALTLGARLVVTDLAHVQRWARERGVGLVTAEGRDLHWLGNTAGLDELLADLAERMVVVPVQAPAGASG